MFLEKSLTTDTEVRKVKVRVKKKVRVKVLRMPRTKKSTRGGARGGGRKRGSKNRSFFADSTVAVAAAEASKNEVNNNEVREASDINLPHEEGPADAAPVPAAPHEYDEIAAIGRFLEDVPSEDDMDSPVREAPGRRSRRSRRVTARVLASAAMDRAAIRAAEHARARIEAREHKQTLSQAMSSQTTASEGRPSNSLGREWRNRAILRCLRRGHPVVQARFLFW